MKKIKYFPNIHFNKKEKEKVFDIILKDNEINAFINEHNIDLNEQYDILYKYYLEKQCCANCKSTKNCLNTFMFYAPKLEYVDEVMDLVHKRCPKIIGFDNFKYSDYSMQDYLLGKKDIKDFEIYAELVIETKRLRTESYSIYVQSDHESTLDFLKITANKLSENNTITFIDLKKRSYMIKEDIYNEKDAFLKYFEQLCQQDMLVIYNLGEESVTQVYIEEFLISIIKRYLNKKIIILSEYTGEELSQIYNQVGNVNVKFRNILKKIKKNIKV